VFLQRQTRFAKLPLMVALSTHPHKPRRNSNPHSNVVSTTCRATDGDLSSASTSKAVRTAGKTAHGGIKSNGIQFNRRENNPWENPQVSESSGRRLHRDLRLHAGDLRTLWNRQDRNNAPGDGFPSLVSVPAVQGTLFQVVSPSGSQGLWLSEVPSPDLRQLTETEPGWFS